MPVPAGNTSRSPGSATPTMTAGALKICTVFPMTDESEPNFRSQNEWLKIVIDGGNVAGFGGGGAGCPGTGGGCGGGGAPSDSTKLRPNTMRVPSSEKKFGVTPAITICSGLPSSATIGPGPALMAAML